MYNAQDASIAVLTALTLDFELYIHMHGAKEKVLCCYVHFHYHYCRALGNAD